MVGRVVEAGTRVGDRGRRNGWEEEAGDMAG